jgi:hypothetical protein
VKWRREESLNDRLLREGEAELAREAQLGAPAGGGAMQSSAFPIAEWAETDALLKQWSQQWDAVVAADAPEVGGERVEFVVLEDGTLIVDTEDGDASLGPLADAVEERLARPYRAEGIRHEGGWWAVGARGTAVCALPGLAGDSLELSVYGGERTVSGVEDGPAMEPIDALAAAKGFSEYGVEAERLDGDLWEVQLSPL